MSIDTGLSRSIDGLNEMSIDVVIVLSIDGSV